MKHNLCLQIMVIFTATLFVYCNKNSDNRRNVPDISSDLIAFYPFTGNSGDSSGNGFHGVVTGALLTHDRFGKNSAAYKFSATNKIILPTLLPLSGAAKITFCFWRRYPNGMPRQADVISMQNKFYFSFSNLEQYGKDSVSIFEQNNYSAISIKNHGDKWNHIALVYDATLSVNKRYALYQNGVFYNYVPINTNGSLLASFPILNGTETTLLQNTDVTSSGKIGELDDVRMYKRALTLEQIAFLAIN
jgi:hypothetical protein